MASFLLISLSSHFLNSSFSASELDSGSGMGNLALFLLGGIGAAEGRLVTVEDGRLPLEVDGTGTAHKLCATGACLCWHTVRAVRRIISHDDLTVT